MNNRIFPGGSSRPGAPEWVSLSGNSVASIDKDEGLSGSCCESGGVPANPNLAFRVSFSSFNARFSARNSRHFSSSSLTFTTTEPFVQDGCRLALPSCDFNDGACVIFKPPPLAAWDRLDTIVRSCCESPQQIDILNHQETLSAIIFFVN